MEKSLLIVGLGNPGREYAGTRHNAGFALADTLAARWKSGWSEVARFNARIARADRYGCRLILCQPQTYMNASGEAVSRVAGYYKIEVRGILVLVDDADLPLGEIRLRPSGGSGGHHGLESIEQHLGSRDYARLRIGIGRTEAESREITAHVLGRFRSGETGLLEKILNRAADQVECWLDQGIAKAMTKFNGPIEPVQKEK